MLDEVPGYPPLECEARGVGMGVQLAALESNEFESPRPFSSNAKQAEHPGTDAALGETVETVTSILYPQFLTPHQPASPSHPSPMTYNVNGTSLGWNALPVPSGRLHQRRLCGTKGNCQGWTEDAS